MKKPKLTLRRLRQLLTYDMTSGVLRWTKNCPQKQFSGCEAGTIKPSGYRLVRIDGQYYRSHRLAWFLVKGKWPPRDIDHKDTDKANNKWENLRLASESQNVANSKPWARKTLPKGVYKRADGRYVAQIKKDRKSHWLGSYATPDAAHAAYAKAAARLHGKFARAA